MASEPASKEASHTGFKFIESDMTSHHERSCSWKVGEWKRWDGPLKMCESGLHYSKTALGSLDYADYGSLFCVVETRNDVETEDTKTVCSEMRIVKVVDRDTVCRKFTIACARHVLPIFEKKYPKDDRPRKAIDAAEAFLKDPSEENRKKMAAARAAARAAAWAAARAAARDAARAAAWAAARDAARDAAWAAAWAAAGAAAWAAEREWQEKTLQGIIEEAPGRGDRKTMFDLRPYIELARLAGLQ